MTDDRETGSIAPQFLALILFLIVAASALSYVIGYALLIEKKTIAGTTEMEAVSRVLLSFTETLEADDTPESDTPQDDVWEKNETEEEGFKIGLRSASSAVNPNYARTNLFDKTGLSRHFKSGTNAQGLQQYRDERGLSAAFSHYEDFFGKDTFNAFFTTYGFANINLLDEFAAEKLGTALTGTAEGGMRLRALIQKILSERRVITRENLEQTLGTDYPELYPYVNAEPEMNVNFAREETLNDILAYPDYGIENPEARANLIVAMRDSSGVTRSDLDSILGVDATHRLYHHFGCVTWFWEITLESEAASYRAIVSRLPAKDADEKTEFRIITIERIK